MSKNFVWIDPLIDEEPLSDSANDVSDSLLVIHIERVFDTKRRSVERAARSRLSKIQCDLSGQKADDDLTIGKKSFQLCKSSLSEHTRLCCTG